MREIWNMTLLWAVCLWDSMFLVKIIGLFLGRMIYVLWEKRYKCFRYLSVMSVVRMYPNLSYSKLAILFNLYMAGEEWSQSQTQYPSEWLQNV